MVESRVWGIIGIVLVLAGAVIIAPDLLGSITEGNVLRLLYGVAVMVATVVTLLTVGRGVAAST